MKQKFWVWMVQCALCITVQNLGNNLIPDMKNVGIVIAVVFASAYICDLYNLIIDLRSKN
ncbi:MAG: hypothetical protein EHM47_00860 [Ignavibacteriales bacterium]|nr:MAG: hypothetical protein EHM47_00860 [Ignavibacteriales bacterium]